MSAALYRQWGIIAVDELADDEAERTELPGAHRRRLSVSQIQEFLKCPRKWALHRLAKVPKTKGEALLFGIALHASLAWYLEDRGTWARKVVPGSKIGAMTQAMARMVAIPMGARVHVEPEWLLPVPELETDLYVKPDLVVYSAPTLFVDDWKSTSAPKPSHVWALQGREHWSLEDEDLDDAELLAEKLPAGARTLYNDAQPRIYGYGLTRLFGAPMFTARWRYGCKAFRPPENPKVWTVTETISKGDNDAWVEANIFPVVKFMNRLRDAWEDGDLDSPLLIPHRGEGCEFVGKFCDALAQCRLTPSPIPAEDFRRHLPVIPQ